MKALYISCLSIILFSCNKDAKKDTFTHEISTENAQIVIPNAGAGETVNNALIQSSNGDYYVTGEIEYTLNGASLATVDFGSGEENSTADLYQNGDITTIELFQETVWYGDKGSKYKRVIVKPIIKSEDCDYLISGVIKYYDIDTHAWVATIDFGDRTCDDIAVKTTADGETIPFNISEWFSEL